MSNWEANLIENINVKMIENLSGVKFLEATWTDENGENQVARGFPMNGWFYSDFSWVDHEIQMQLNRWTVAYEVWVGALPVYSMSEDLGIPKRDYISEEEGFAHMVQNMFGPHK